MADRPTDDAGWLLEPPAPGEVHLSIAIGSEVELSPEVRGALDQLMSTFAEEEVSGFMLNVDVAGLDAGKKRCPSRCYVLTKRPPDCPSLVQCKIG